MKLLLDEQLPTTLRHELDEAHEVFSAEFMRWKGKKNGELLGLMLWHGFEGLITNDKNLIYQQNLSKVSIKFFVLNSPTNNLPDLIPRMKKLDEILKNPPEKQVIEIEIN